MCGIGIRNGACLEQLLVIFITQEELFWYGIDWTGPIPTDVESVDIPPVNLLPPILQDVLLQEIDPTRVHDNPEQLYIATRVFVHTFALN